MALTLIGGGAGVSGDLSDEAALIGNSIDSEVIAGLVRVQSGSNSNVVIRTNGDNMEIDVYYV